MKTHYRILCAFLLHKETKETREREKKKRERERYGRRDREEEEEEEEEEERERERGGERNCLCGESFRARFPLLGVLLVCLQEGLALL